jgi:hypothetical protein
VGWEVKGVLLSPQAIPWAASHAAVPHIRRDERGLQLFFSSRDEHGRSHVGRAHLELAPERASAISEPGPVLSPGSLGAFDDSGVTTSCLIDYRGRSFLYYTGWSLGRTVPFYLQVGCAISDDARTFDRVSPAPIIERSATDPYLIASPWVIEDGGRLRMWYVSATGWSIVDGKPRHRYHIKYAESADGLEWRREGLVAVDFASEDEYAISRPCVVKDEDRYRMWFSSRGDTYRIGYAESDDGFAWERKTAPELTSSGTWDSEMQAYPAVFDYAGRRYLVYNGNGYGRTGIGWAASTTAANCSS